MTEQTTLLENDIARLSENIAEQYAIDAHYFEDQSIKRGLRNADGTGVLIGLLELTQGLAHLTPHAGTLAARLTTVSFLCAFGGVSVLFQTAAVTDGLAFRACLRGKLVHALLAALVCAAALHVVPTSWLESL